LLVVPAGSLGAPLLENVSAYEGGTGYGMGYHGYLGAVVAMFMLRS